MENVNNSTQVIQNEMVKIISSIKKVHPNKLLEVRDFTELDFDILDVVDIILAVEKNYHLTIPDEVPVYSIDDFINYVYTQNHKQAS
ncbi:acyl carrier protein [Pontibacter rugosus]|uniref:Acyl carrier protein n=1 Tax=Pontibacter rugosus TaxID=1745966 RepID=A0ABW3SMW3_9BACT